MKDKLRPLLRDSMPIEKMEACGIRLDISRQRIDAQQYRELLALADEKGVLEQNREMQQGSVVNVSEGRAALHTSLRNPSENAPFHAQVQDVLERLCACADDIRSGVWTGCRGDSITDVINVGIGGSDVGPRAVYYALQKPNMPIRLHFLSAVDGTIFERVTSGLNPFKTLVVVSSKSFTTRETAVNAAAVDEWFARAGIVNKDRAYHMLLVSANSDAPRQMRLPRENYFPIWDWVGGRFSVWSAVGFPIAIALGSKVFRELLEGAHAMDCHAMNAPKEKNLPLNLALLSYWNANQNDMKTHCFLPYDERLRVMVQWLQQLEMESLGKNRTLHGQRVEGFTGQSVWGGHGNESQHSFYQWLREGTVDSSIDLLYCTISGHKHDALHRVLLANAKAQAEALITRHEDDPYGNAVSTFEIDELTPKRLGALMAMYEHKTTMLGTLLNINPFDQPGVELGKLLSRRVEEGMQ